MNTPFPPTAEQQCGNCRYIRGSRCHRYAPQPDTSTDAYLSSGQVVPYWPMVSERGWCGEWAATD